MARIDWVARRLDNWALWCDRARSGGLGFASQSIFADGPAVRGGCDAEGPRIPVLELEASETHEAVESLKLGHGHLYQTLRVCERFRGTLKISDLLPGFDPTKETHRAALAAYEHVRQVEELRERAVAI